MVYALPLYHPLRMIEEICMLDQMSRGRLDIGFGRGSSPRELQFFGEDYAEAQAKYAEALEAIIQGLTHQTVDFHGKYYNIDSFPLAIETLQKPYPPIWYGVHAVDSAERAAKRGLQVIELDQVKPTQDCYDRFKAVWRDAQPGKPLPLMGLGRFVVVAETDEEARKYRDPRLSPLVGQLHLPASPPRLHRLASAAAGIRGDRGRWPRLRRLARRPCSGSHASRWRRPARTISSGNSSSATCRPKRACARSSYSARHVMPALKDS